MERPLGFGCLRKNLREIYSLRRVNALVKGYAESFCLRGRFHYLAGLRIVVRGGCTGQGVGQLAGGFMRADVHRRSDLLLAALDYVDLKRQRDKFTCSLK